MHAYGEKTATRNDAYIYGGHHYTGLEEAQGW